MGEWTGNPDALCERIDIMTGDAAYQMTPATRALLTEAAACIREMVKWRPIETAPRDGTVVLGFWRFRTFDSYVITPVTLRPDGGWVQKWDHDEVSPTHWLPLPPAPGAEDE